MHEKLSRNQIFQFSKLERQVTNPSGYPGEWRVLVEKATRVPIGFTEMLYEINLETPISALLISQNDEAHVLLNEEIDVFSSLRQN